ncbi:hypothetical protein PaecuDRAFT_0444 [Paenibacillus curdlanolyticus YK9]|uniref:Helicase XPB/Ssl2 N-terminal domain-containing protein n=2 Tax=Paenibacillus curdlanolyticus TaxID=59840 RepID=E0I3R9_9BACL|nr:hypothetical protein PaecuDRAFT_0444 [Paenibacillus curdlanolyticus YK9]
MLAYWTSRMSMDAVARVQTASIWSNAKSIEWPRSALEPEILKEVKRRLSVNASRLLGYWIREAGPLPMPEERILNTGVRGIGLAGAEVRAALHELCEYGILFAVRKSWGERLFFLPRDSYMAWRRAQGYDESYWKEAPSAGGSFDGAGRRVSEQLPLGRRLVRAYAALKRTELKLTAKGLFPKKTIADSLSALGWEQADAAALFDFVKPVHLEHYPAPFAVVLDVAAKLGLLRRAQATVGFAWDNVRLEQWLMGSPLLREAELLRLITMHYSWEGAEMISFTSELLLLKPRVEYSVNQPLTSCQNSWMQVMSRFGWANAAAREDGSMSYCWLIDPWEPEKTTDEEAYSLTEDIPLIVLPDGELIVSPSASYDLTWTLEQAAQWVRDDAVSIYRLTSQSVAAAVEGGMDQEKLLNALREASGGLPIPEELERAVGHWAAQANRTMLEEVLLLRCDSVEIANAAYAHPAIKGLLAERIGERSFIVRPADVPSLRQQLERAGWPLAKNKPSAIPALEQSSNEGQLVEAGPFIVDGHALQIYELESPERIVADAGNSKDNQAYAPAQWPASWTGQLRAYHHSTRRQIVESALAWGAPIEIKSEGRLVELVPERLSGFADRWVVSGFLRGQTDEVVTPVDLSPHMWEEMRIIIPSPFVDNKRE